MRAVKRDWHASASDARHAAQQSSGYLGSISRWPCSKTSFYTDQVSDSAGATELRPREHYGHDRRVQDRYSDEVTA